MQRPGKIARLPRHIREELNQRLDNSAPSKTILEWVNALPEVQTILKAEFEDKPITRQNLSDWERSPGFRTWRLRRDALEFSEESIPDELDQSTLEKISAKLLRFLQLRYAAVANALPAPAEDPEAELRLLARLCGDLTALRRGDLSAGRLTLEQERLALEKSKSDAAKEQEFWQWTKRPDIQAKLYPHRDPEKIRREVDRMLSRRLLGIRDPGDEPDETQDPAILI